jgi:rubrerythrin
MNGEVFTNLRALPDGRLAQTGSNSGIIVGNLRFAGLAANGSSATSLPFLLSRKNTSKRRMSRSRHASASGRSWGRFGEHIPPIRREDVKGFLQRRPLWLVRPLGVNAARKHAQVMEMEAVRFYQRAADRVTHAGTRELLNKLADEERKHTETAGNLQEKHLTEHARAAEAESHKKLFLLQVIQPGLAGLMDGSVSTLAPLFAAAYASHKTWEAFLVGMAASLGAGIWKYIAADNLDAADHVVAEIQEAIRTLVPFPHLGHQRPDLTSRPLRFHRYEISLRMRLTNNPS